jgi:hypothetical protein
MDLRYSIGEALGTDYLGLGTGGIPVAADREDAVRDRRPFNPRTGLPDAAATGAEMVTWYEHARAYTEAKWPNLAPVARRSGAEALVTVTIALTAKDRGAPEVVVTLSDHE